jgi:hypothetical protein
MILTLWLSLLDRPTGAMPGGPDAVWTKQVETGAVPTVHDYVYLWADDGPNWQVRRRYMDAAGGWHVELSRMAVDPSETARDYIMRTHTSSMTSGPSWSIWWTERDGDPVPHLREGGWKLYGEEQGRG